MAHNELGLTIGGKTIRPQLGGREIVRVGRVYAQRFARDTSLPRAEYLARLHAIAEELYPAKRYPGVQA
jgi:hypothetical protein